MQMPDVRSVPAWRGEAQGLATDDVKLGCA